jgi:hypothetical protein
MRFVSRSLIASCAVVVGLGVGCSSNQEAAPDSAAASGSAKKAPLTTTAQKRIDPLVMKTYRADACHFGALSLVQARAAYLDSLGGGEPSESKIPEFGLDAVTTPTKDAPSPTPAPESSAKPVGSGAPKAATSAAPKPPAPSAAAKPATSAKASAAPAASAATPPAASGSAGLRPPPDRLANNFRSLPYERFIRSCNVAAGLKEPAAPEYDAAVKAFADYALPLSKALQDANAYYQKGTYKEDSFAKGKELHKTIVDGFGKLDAELKKLQTATETWQKANPINKADHEEGQKLADKAVADANAIILGFAGGTVPKDAIAAFEASSGALKKYGDDNKDKKDPWATLLPPQNTSFLEQAKLLVDVDPKAVGAAKIVNLITLHSRILETNHRALTRKNAGEGRMPGAAPNPRNLKPKMPANHPE